MRYHAFMTNRGTYQFPAQTADDNNFPSAVTDTTRIYGMDGGLDLYGNDPTPQEIGSISLSWWIFDDPATGAMTRHVDSAKAMAGWGRGRLFAAEDAPKAGLRWTFARLNDLNASRNVQNTPHRRRQIRATFQAPSPHWRGSLSQPWWFDAGFALDNDYYLDGQHYLDHNDYLDDNIYLIPEAIVRSLDDGESTTFINYGNHAVKPSITVAAMTPAYITSAPVQIGPDLYTDQRGSDINTFTLEHYWGGKLRSSVRYSGFLSGTDREHVVIDCERLTVVEHGTWGIRPAYAKYERVAGFPFPLLYPGENTFRLTGTFGSAGALLTVDTLHGWY